MIRRLLARFRGVIFGLFFGFGLAVLFVTWRDDAFYIKEKLIIEDYGELFVCRVRIEQKKNKQHNSKKQKNLANKQISQILVEVNVLLASRHNMVCRYSKEEENLEPFLYQFFIKLSSICIPGLS